MAFPDGPLAGAPVKIPQGTGELNTPIMPTWDQPGGEPDLAYKVAVAGGNASITIFGANFVGPYSAVLVDITQVTPNSGSAPVILSLTTSPSQLDMTLDPSASTAGDIWGILLTDGNGADRAPPSPILMV